MYGLIISATKILFVTNSKKYSVALTDHVKFGPRGRILARRARIACLGNLAKSWRKYFNALIDNFPIVP